MISPPIMWIIGNKSGEFQERLTLSQLEAKQYFIFLMYLVIIRYIMVFFIVWAYCLKCVRSTTSRWVLRKDDNSATSARGLALYFTFFPNFVVLSKTIQLLMAWLSFLLIFYINVISPDCDYVCLIIVTHPILGEVKKTSAPDKFKYARM